jgi:hypothetical protein
MKTITVLSSLCFLVAGCSHGEVPSEVLKSPNGDYSIEVYRKDLGACCTSNSRAMVVSRGGTFKGMSEKIFEIEGGSDVHVSWDTPYSIVVQVCNAKSVSFRSDFANSDFSKYIHVAVSNVLPQRQDGKVICLATELR